MYCVRFGKGCGGSSLVRNLAIKVGTVKAVVGGASKRELERKPASEGPLSIVARAMPVAVLRANLANDGGIKMPPSFKRLDKSCAVSYSSNNDACYASYWAKKTVPKIKPQPDFGDFLKRASLGLNEWQVAGLERSFMELQKDKVILAHMHNKQTTNWGPSQSPNKLMKKAQIKKKADMKNISDMVKLPKKPGISGKTRHIEDEINKKAESFTKESALCKLAGELKLREAKYGGSTGWLNEAPTRYSGYYDYDD